MSEPVISARTSANSVQPELPPKKIVTQKSRGAYIKERKDSSGKVIERRVQVVNTRETGRNEPCPCGSGKKFKKCCLV